MCQLGHDKEGNIMSIRRYNELVRKIAVQHSQHYGIDTPQAREFKARLIREVRQDFPYNEQRKVA